MRRINVIGSTAVAVLLAVGAAMGQRTVSLADNAALRYWAAFSQLQDAAITDEEAKELDSVLDTMASFNISKYSDLIQKNTLALEIMARGSALPSCDWGLDYGLGGDVPVDYARKALVLGRLNVLYAMQLYHSGNPDGAIGALTAGLRFSHDVANGGSLFATLVAKNLIVTHLMAVGDALRMGQLSTTQRSRLQNAVTALGDGLEWSAAAKRDLEALGQHYSGESRVSAALSRITSSYTAFLKDESNLPSLMDAINHAPPELANLIPNPKRVQEQKQELSEKLQQTRALLQSAAPR
jgi:hypothetical protein